MSSRSFGLGPRALPLVCLHGWGLSGLVWDDLRVRLTQGTVADSTTRAKRPDTDLPHRQAASQGEEQARDQAPMPALTASSVVYPLDLPGYRGDPLPDPYTPESISDCLAEVCPTPCSVLGWSLGGMVALAWAARHPEQVKSLILVGTTPVFVNRPDWAFGLEAAVVDGFAKSLMQDTGATLRRFLALQARGGDEARSVIARLRTLLLAKPLPPSTTLAAGLKLLRAADLRPLVPKVRCPTLVVHGGHDALCPPQAALWLAQHLSTARLALHERAAHAPFLSHPAWFADTLLRFLTENDG